MGQVSSRVRPDGAYSINPDRFRISQAQASPNDGEQTGLVPPTSDPTGVTPIVSVYHEQVDNKPKLSARRGDGRPLAFIQDPETDAMVLSVSYLPSIMFKFRLNIKLGPQQPGVSNLTFVTASSFQELESFMSTELLQNPNIQDEDNVVFLGDFSSHNYVVPTIVQRDFCWNWEPHVERIGGWPIHFCFCEYAKDEHKLWPLAGGAFWITERPEDGGLTTKYGAFNILSPVQPPPRDSTMFSAPAAGSGAGAGSGSGSNAGTQHSGDSPTSSQPSNSSFPAPAPAASQPAASQSGPSTPGPNVLHASSRNVVETPLAERPSGIHLMTHEEGPMFRSKIAAMERHSVSMKIRIKQLLKRAIFTRERLQGLIEADQWFGSAIVGAGDMDIPSLRPVSLWFNRNESGGLSATQRQRKLAMTELTNHVIEPLRKLYENEVKNFELRKREFDDETSQFYSYLSKYLSKKDKDKQHDTGDAKYAEKRRAFELLRFDYYQYLLDTHGGSKLQDTVLQIAKYAQSISDSQIALGQEVKNRVRPSIDHVVDDMKDAAKFWSQHRTERAAYRRMIAKSADGTLPEDINLSSEMLPAEKTITDPGSPSMGLHSDTDDEEPRKEGLLWASNRPSGFQEQNQLKQQGIKWHKYWVVQENGRICEYTNWKQGEDLDLHNEPINLQLATVREARAADRRFCFEVVTPHYKRVYQATSDEDMHSWIAVISRSISHSIEHRTTSTGSQGDLHVAKRDKDKKLDVLTRKLSLRSEHRPRVPPISTHMGQGGGANLELHSPQPAPATASVIPNGGGIYSPPPAGPQSAIPIEGLPDSTAKILMIPSNRRCADCYSSRSVEWVSINLFMVLCIDCSGAHRSLGSHISKIRSLRLDTSSFTQDLLAAFTRVSNDQMNAIWEAKLSPESRPHQFSGNSRLKFIGEKYVEKQWIQELEKPNTVLRRAIAEQDVVKMSAALAARANPNGRSDEDEPMVVYALRCAPPDAHIFPCAAVLIINGASVPPESPAGLNQAQETFLQLHRKRV